MDKYELRVSLDEIDRLISERRFKEAAGVADRIDWTRIKGTQTLCRISDLYKINKRYRESRDLLAIAYKKNPESRKIIYSLCELELKLNNYIHALQLYNAFINVAPRDSDRYLLQYKLYKKQEVNVLEQIAVLEEFQQHDFRERWAYELATLYYRAGDVQSCIRQCDEIVAYFGDGRFVLRALELKKSLTDLNPQQNERLELLKKGGKYVPPVQPEPVTDAAPEAADAVKDAASAVPGAGDNTAPGMPESGKAAAPEQPVPESGNAAASAMPESGKNTAAAVSEAAGRADGPENLTVSSLNPDGSSGPDRAKPAAQTSADQTRRPAEEETSRKEAEISGNGHPDQGIMEPEPDEEEADASEPAGTPEEYTDTLLNDVHMEETIAQGMREIGDYDSVLAQETSGQLAMVMEEEEKEESQIEGQLNLEQIMSEWEKIRKESEQKRLADARRRVLERSDAAKRQLYGDDFVRTGAGSGRDPEPEEFSGSEKSSSAPQDFQGRDEAGKTRSWRREDVESGLKKNRKKNL